MSAALQALRSANARLISDNPVAVVIRRAENVPASDGGVERRETMLPSFFGRMVARRVAPSISQDEAGALRHSSLTLIAPDTPRLVAGDVALVGSVRYNVMDVALRSWQSSVYAQHAAVERVS